MSHEQTSPRAARLAEIRRRIAAGTYDTPLRLEAAIEAFLDSADACPLRENSSYRQEGDHGNFAAR